MLGFDTYDILEMVTVVDYNTYIQYLAVVIEPNFKFWLGCRDMQNMHIRIDPVQP